MAFPAKPPPFKTLYVNAIPDGVTDVTDRAITRACRLAFAGEFADSYYCGPAQVRMCETNGYEFFKTVEEAAAELRNFQQFSFDLMEWKKSGNADKVIRHSSWLLKNRFWPLFKEHKLLVAMVAASPDNAAQVLRDHNKKITEMVRYSQPVRRMQVA